MTPNQPEDDRLDTLETLLGSAARYAESAHENINLLSREVRSIGARVDQLADIVAQFIRQSEADRLQASADRRQAEVDRRQAEVDRQEFRSYMRGLQTENNRILSALEQLLQQNQNHS
jgi:hypothetical protein